MASGGETRDWLLAERQRVQAHKRELEAQQERERELLRELHGVERDLARHQPPRRLPLLDRVRVASPCTQPWGDMVGDDRSRHCLACNKQVYDISAMSRESAEAFLQAAVGEGACVRIYRRADGTLLTADDCPVGVRSKRRKRFVLAAGASALVAGAAFAAVEASSTKCTMGDDGVEGKWFGGELVRPTAGEMYVEPDTTIDPAMVVDPKPAPSAVAPSAAKKQEDSL